VQRDVRAGATTFSLVAWRKDMDSVHMRKLKKAIAQRAQIAEVLGQVAGIDVETLAICAAMVSLKGGQCHNDNLAHPEEQGEFNPVTEWAMRIWFDCITLSLFLAGHLKVQGVSADNMRLFADIDDLIELVPPAFVTIFKMAAKSRTIGGEDGDLNQ
jgi:hypothetical protein